jgi:hypothetical protein
MRRTAVKVTQEPASSSSAAIWGVRCNLKLENTFARADGRSSRDRFASFTQRRKPGPMMDGAPEGWYPEGGFVRYNRQNPNYLNNRPSRADKNKY